MWATPGGKVDLELGDFVIEETIKREVAEEVGIQIGDHIEYLGSNAFIRSCGHHVISIVLLSTWQAGKAMSLEGQSEIRWFTLSQLNKLEVPDYFRTWINILVKHETSKAGNNKTG